MPIDSVLHTNQHSIDRLLNAGLPVALVFWDHNHVPVLSSDDALDSLAKKYAGRALIAKINAAEETELLGRFAVNGVPSFAFVDKGTVIERTQVDDPAYVEAWLSHLANGGSKPARPSQPQSTASGRTATNASSATSNGGKPVTLTDANFQSHVNDSKPTLVDFWAEWCGPCRMVAPSIETLAKEFEGRANVGKLNVEENQATAGRFGIRSIPSLLIFKNGQVVDQIVGAQPLPVLRQRLSAHV